MDDGQFEMALPILEEGLMKTRESVPEKHIDLAVGEILYIPNITVCILKRSHNQKILEKM
jgi:hypothetical protein